VVRGLSVAMQIAGIVFASAVFAVREPDRTPAAAGVVAREPVPAPGAASFVVHEPAAVSAVEVAAMGAAGGSLPRRPP